MPKAIKSDARNIILKVKSFFEEESRQQAPIIPFNQIYKRISAATGQCCRFLSHKLPNIHKSVHIELTNL